MRRVEEPGYDGTFLIESFPLTILWFRETHAHKDSSARCIRISFFDDIMHMAFIVRILSGVHFDFTCGIWKITFTVATGYFD